MDESQDYVRSLIEKLYEEIQRKGEEILKSEVQNVVKPSIEITPLANDRVAGTYVLDENKIKINKNYMHLAENLMGESLKWLIIKQAIVHEHFHAMLSQTKGKQHYLNMQKISKKYKWVDDFGAELFSYWVVLDTAKPEEKEAVRQCLREYIAIMTHDLVEGSKEKGQTPGDAFFDDDSGPNVMAGLFFYESLHIENNNNLPSYINHLFEKLVNAISQEDATKIFEEVIEKINETNICYTQMKNR